MPPFDPNDPVQTALQTAQQVRDKPSYSTPIDPMRRELTSSGLFSHAADVLANSKQNKGTWQQYRAALLKNGVKPDEMKWSGADEKFQPNQMLTREQLKRHFDTALPKLHEKTYSDDDYDYADDTGATGGPQYKDYTLPGGKNYREVLMQLPSGRKTSVNTMRHQVTFHTPEGARVEHATMPQIEAARRRGMQVDVHGPTYTHDDSANYHSSHWQGVPNVVAHLRMSDRPLPNKRKALHLEELQSDWAQEGRQKGFSDPAKTNELLQAQTEARRKVEEARTHLRHKMADTPEIDAVLGPLQQHYNDITKAYHKASSGTPHAPYVDNTSKWTDLGLKRALHETAKGGYDKLLITPGEEQAKRYDLSNHINAARYFPEHKNFQATRHDGRVGISENNVEPGDLPKYLGHELAAKLLATPKRSTELFGPHHALEGLDMHVGGEGMKAFYDKIVPQALEKLARKHDPEAKVVLHGHDLPIGQSSKNPWHVIGDDGHIANSFATESSARRWANDRGGDVQYRSKNVRKLHSLEVTPKMRQSILKGQAAYASGGTVVGNAVAGAVSSAADASDKGQLDKRANDLIGQIAANSKPSADPGDDYAKGGKVHAARIKRTTHRHPDGGVMHTYDEAGKASLSSRVKPVKSAPTSPSVDEALRIAAEATR